MTTLISFLGKANEKGYRETTYQFDDESCRKSSYFGLALTDYLRADRLIIFGTAGSMWDVFFEQQGAHDEEVLALIDAVHDSRVDLAMLEAQEARLTQKIGYPVICRLISYARDAKEQSDILLTLAKLIKDGETIALDVTHGFRHLPMLTLVAARYLTHIRNVKIKGIYYGAYEMKSDDITPVLQLDGMLQMLDWVESLATYKKDGDYGVFAPLLSHDGMRENDVSQLTRAAYFERNNNPTKAKEFLSGVFPAIEKHEGSMSALFKEELQERISWFRGQDRADCELRLAEDYFERHDYVRALMILYESFVTRAGLKHNMDINNFDQRKNAWKEEKGHDKRLHKLEHVRNAFAHGIKPEDNEIASLLSSEKHFVEWLKSQFKHAKSFT